MKIFARKVFFLVATAGLMSTVLSNMCVTTKRVREAVIPEPSPGLVAQQNPRYSAVKGFDYGRVPISSPTISVLLTKDKIWVGVRWYRLRHFRYGESGPFSNGLQPQNLQWKLRNTNDEYDWEAAEDLLREIPAHLTKEIAESEFYSFRYGETLTQEVERPLSMFEKQVWARQAGILGIISAKPQRIEIAAEKGVTDDVIQTAMDMAAQFTDIAYVDARHLSVQFRE